ncbi:NAD(P)-dependent oxidoreductase [Gottschalkiaceae bacterium SANA]|nr:NAD(P)-dependent oxidoreductase [Gottschalkiaceae bacterium SANA]
MNIAIIGASGFIGQHLTKRYLENGDSVTAFVPHVEKLNALEKQYKNLKVICTSFDDFDSLSSMVYENICFDIFYYLAWDGYGKATNDYKEQVKNIKPLCDAIVEAKKIGSKKFLFASSLSEYMIKEGSNLSHNEGGCCNVYGSAKHAARLLAQAVATQQDIPFISIAFANTFGPGDMSHRSSNLFINQLLKGQDLNLTEGNHMYDWNYIDDAVDGLKLAGEQGKPDELYYIGNRSRRPLKEIISEVRDILAPEAKINFGKYHEDFYMDYSCMDTHKLYRDTGYLARTNFKEAITATAEWVRTLNWY